MNGPKPFVAVPNRAANGEVVSVSTREPTTIELDKARTERAELEKLVADRAALDARIIALEAACTHLVRIDEPGFIYDSRYCFVCKRFLEMV